MQAATAVTEAIARSDIELFDRSLTERVIGLARPIIKRYFRSEVRGLANSPPGPSLVVGRRRLPIVG